MGTGSGCISVTLALGISGAEVDAWDISDDAIAIAQKNAASLKANVNVVKCDALNPPHDDGKYDVIVSNPPYICQSESIDMDSNVLQYEPHVALFVPDGDALMFYCGIARYASSALRAGGTLFFEVNPLYVDELGEMLLKYGFCQVEIRTDQFGKQRFVKASRQ